MEYLLDGIQPHYEESDFIITFKIVVYNIIAMGALAVIKQFLL